MRLRLDSFFCLSCVWTGCSKSAFWAHVTCAYSVQMRLVEKNDFAGCWRPFNPTSDRLAADAARRAQRSPSPRQQLPWQRRETSPVRSCRETKQCRSRRRRRRREVGVAARFCVRASCASAACITAIFASCKVTAATSRNWTRIRVAVPPSTRLRGAFHVSASLLQPRV